MTSQNTTAARTHTITVHHVEVTLTEHGEGRHVLLLHGGGGPLTVSPWAAYLAQARPAHVVVPTHPGFAGTPRPESLHTIPGLARLYVDLLDRLDLDDVCVIGNSIGGWIAAEMAALSPARVSHYVILDAVGADVPGHPVADFFSLTPAEIAHYSYADPDTYAIDPTSLSPAAQQAVAENRIALQTYAGTTMTDPTLLPRLRAVTTPTLVAWGEADRIGDPELGQAITRAIPNATFALVADAGHLPQIEQPGTLTDLVWSFITGT